jgi:hypothetical protein
MASKGKRENLKPVTERTKEEAREISKKGGVASGEARRRKKTMREALEMLLFHTELNEKTKQMLKDEGIKNTDDFNHQMVITRSLIAKAESGDVQAYNAICAMIGEKPADKIDLGGDIFSRVRVVREQQQHDGFTANSEDDIPDD